MMSADTDVPAGMLDCALALPLPWAALPLIVVVAKVFTPRKLPGWYPPRMAAAAAKGTGDVSTAAGPCFLTEFAGRQLCMRRSVLMLLPRCHPFIPREACYHCSRSPLLMTTAELPSPEKPTEMLSEATPPGPVMPAPAGSQGPAVQHRPSADRVDVHACTSGPSWQHRQGSNSAGASPHLQLSLRRRCCCGLGSWRRRWRSRRGR